MPVFPGTATWRSRVKRVFFAQIILIDRLSGVAADFKPNSLPLRSMTSKEIDISFPVECGLIPHRTISRTILSRVLLVMFVAILLWWVLRFPDNPHG